MKNEELDVTEEENEAWEQIEELMELRAALLKEKQTEQDSRS